MLTLRILQVKIGARCSEGWYPEGVRRIWEVSISRALRTGSVEMFYANELPN